jgi:hypothetical protein
VGEQPGFTNSGAIETLKSNILSANHGKEIGVNRFIFMERKV